MDAQLATVLPVADIHLARAAGADLHLRKISADPEHRTSAALALDTVTGHDKAGLTGSLNLQCATAAMGGSNHDKTPTP
jgi:hypothetical protein